MGNIQIIKNIFKINFSVYLLALIAILTASYKEFIVINIIVIIHELGHVLVANLFRINQTKQKLIKDNIKGEKDAKSTHYEVGKKVRKAIKDIGGTMPEDLPTPSKSIKQIEKDNVNNLIMKGMNDNE